MLRLVTGTPGSGKSLYVITELSKITDRKIYYYGIEGLQLDWQLLNDPKNWPDEVEDGSIVVIDEVQKVFGVRSPRDPIPAAVSALETHRHRGLDIWYITQHPSMLDHHARRLVGEHFHFKRPFGAPFAIRYQDNEVFDPADASRLRQVNNEKFFYPKMSFGLYKSAEVHTHKLKLPKRLLMIPVGVVAVGFLAYFAYQQLPTNADDADSSVLGLPSDEASGFSDSMLPQSLGNSGSSFFSGSQMIDPEVYKREFIVMRTPVLPEIQESAPIYANALREVALEDVPRMAGCMATKTRCQCYTQQGAPYPVSEDICRARVNLGSHDIYRSRRRGSQPEPASQNQTDTPPELTSYSPVSSYQFTKTGRF